MPPGLFCIGGQNTSHYFYKVDKTPPIHFSKVDIMPPDDISKMDKTPPKTENKFRKEQEQNTLQLKYDIAA